MSETDDLEQPLPGTVEGRTADPGDIAATANEADAAEQRAALDEDDVPREWFAQLPAEASEADATEQRREVRLDEDEYR